MTTMHSLKTNHHRSSTRICFGALAALALVSSSSSSLVSAFSHTRMVEQRQHRGTSPAVLGISTGMNEDDNNSSGNNNNGDGFYKIFAQAREFALESDTTVQGTSSLTDEEALLEKSRFWLSETLRLQSSIVNADEVEEVVCRLKARIAKHEKRIAKRQQGTESVVPWIATELSVGALLVVVAIFWTTLDLGYRHDDIPSLENFQQWIGIIKEKEYILFGDWLQ